MQVLKAPIICLSVALLPYLYFGFPSINRYFHRYGIVFTAFSILTTLALAVSFSNPIERKLKSVVTLTITPYLGSIAGYCAVAMQFYIERRDIFSLPFETFLIALFFPYVAGWLWLWSGIAVALFLLSRYFPFNKIEGCG